MAIIFNNNYYLMCLSSKYNGITNYRLDCMDQAKVIDAPVDEGAIIHADSIESFITQAFNMYGESVENVALQFPEKLIGVIYDKFGEDTVITKHEDGTYTATVQVQESPTFQG